MSSTRRTFVVQLAGAGALIAAPIVCAQGAKVEETDPQAAALGYKADTAKVDEKKYPKHAATQKCATCQLFQGKAGDAAGGCPIFAGKQVSAAGWCSAWAKKVA